MNFILVNGAQFMINICVMQGENALWTFRCV